MSFNFQSSIKTATLNSKTNLIGLKFSGGDFTSTLQFVKTLPGRKFRSIDRVWEVPHIKSVVKKITEFGFALVGEGWTNENENLPTPSKKVNKTKLHPDVRPFQIRAVEFLEAVGGIGMDLDQQGLGKTVVAVSYLRLHPELRPALVICPASLKTNWQREVLKWGGEHAYIWPEGQDDSEGIFITNYDQLIKYEETEEEKRIRKQNKEHKNDPSYHQKKVHLIDYEGIFSQFGFKIIVGDEVQYISNGSALRTKYFSRLARRIDKKVFLSGTPIRSKPSQFFTVLNLVAPSVFPNRWQYQMKYCAPRVGYKGHMQFDGASNLGELHNLTSQFYIRRLKSEVLTELPPKRRMVVPLDLDPVEATEYWNADDQFMNWVQESRRSKIEKRNKLAAMRQLAYQAKRESLFEWIDNWLDNNPDENLSLFAYHKKVMNDLEEHYKDIAVRIDGSTPSKKRQEIVDRFNHDKSVRLLIGQMIAAGTGLSFTSTSTCAFVEMWWIPADMEQAEDRQNGIGRGLVSKLQTDIYYLVAAGTIEDDMRLALTDKNEIVKKVLDDIDGDEYFDEDFLETVLRNRGKRQNANSKRSA